MDQWGLVLKIVGPIAAALITYQQRRFFSRPRAKLRADSNRRDNSETAAYRLVAVTEDPAEIDRILAEAFTETPLLMKSQISQPVVQ